MELRATTGRATGDGTKHKNKKSKFALFLRSRFSLSASKETVFAVGREKRPLHAPSETARRSHRGREIISKRLEGKRGGNEETQGDGEERKARDLFFNSAAKQKKENMAAESFAKESHPTSLSPPLPLPPPPSLSSSSSSLLLTPCLSLFLSLSLSFFSAPPPKKKKRRRAASARPAGSLPAPAWASPTAAAAAPGLRAPPRPRSASLCRARLTSRGTTSSAS